MMTEGKHEGASPGEEDAALWSLLERAPRPKGVSPYFARRVLREVNALAENNNAPAAGPALGWLARLRRSWQGQGRGVFAGALGAVALLAAGAGFSPLRWHAPVSPDAVPRVASADLANAQETGDDDEDDNNAPSPRVAVSESSVAAQDVEVIADLDNLLSHEESRLWTEDDTARF